MIHWAWLFLAVFVGFFIGATVINSRYYQALSKIAEGIEEVKERIQKVKEEVDARSKTT